LIKKSVNYPKIPDSFNEEQKKFCEDLFSLVKDLRTELTDKVDWIPVTYINSWVDYNADLTSEYYKDIFGYVHLRIGCKDGSTANPFIMPDGYRPTNRKDFYIFSIPSGTTVVPDIFIQPDGSVTFYYYTNVGCINGEIIYRAA
jgi:hypothetical protein